MWSKEKENIYIYRWLCIFKQDKYIKIKENIRYSSKEKQLR